MFLNEDIASHVATYLRWEDRYSFLCTCRDFKRGFELFLEEDLRRNGEVVLSTLLALLHMISKIGHLCTVVRTFGELRCTWDIIKVWNTTQSFTPYRIPSFYGTISLTQIVILLESSIFEGHRDG